MGNVAEAVQRDLLKRRQCLLRPALGALAQAERDRVFALKKGDPPFGSRLGQGYQPGILLSFDGFSQRRGSFLPFRRVFAG